jgi:hypothetical protein
MKAQCIQAVQHAIGRTLNQQELDRHRGARAPAAAADGARGSSPVPVAAGECPPDRSGPARGGRARARGAAEEGAHRPHDHGARPGDGVHEGRAGARHRQDGRARPADRLQGRRQKRRAVSGDPRRIGEAQRDAPAARRLRGDRPEVLRSLREPRRHRRAHPRDLRPGDGQRARRQGREGMARGRRGAAQAVQRRGRRRRQAHELGAAAASLAAEGREGRPRRVGRRHHAEARPHAVRARRRRALHRHRDEGLPRPRLGDDRHRRGEQDRPGRAARQRHAREPATPNHGSCTSATPTATSTTRASSATRTSSA